MDLNYDEQCKDAFYSLDKVSGHNQTATNPALNGLTTDGTPNNFQYHGKVMVWSAGFFHQLSINTKHFASIYLIVYGITKIGLVAGLLRGKLWSYSQCPYGYYLCRADCV